MSNSLPDDYLLPCDIHLPPNTYIRKGCRMSALITALTVREKWDDESTRFPHPDRSKDGGGPPRTKRPKFDLLRKLILVHANPAPDASPSRVPSPEVMRGIGAAISKRKR